MSSVALLDEAVLAGCLEANVPGFNGPLSAGKFSGGQSNPTFRIDADSGTYVLRRQPPGKLLKSAARDIGDMVDPLAYMALEIVA